ncbi:YigZ family protein [Frigidibacter sp. SD6-1]|uniref:YigZ family protein n=1 Tax=Frigidibacter sp. SD6-1 TaxID=3032581 RepID=UPI0024E0114C|nr:YigZ family protein [Frigidibacter sp. SD6-1]
MRILDTGINDRGSRYAVSGGPVRSRAEILSFLAALKREKRFARATHNSWAAVLADGGPVKGDDGEAGAGNVILQHLQAAGLTDHLIVVTRWYGGKHLGGDRFRNVAETVRLYLSSLP